MIPEMTRPMNIPSVGPVLMIERLNARFAESLSSDTNGSNNCVTGVNKAERKVKVRNDVYPPETHIPSLDRDVMSTDGQTLMEDHISTYQNMVVSAINIKVKLRRGK